jgi:hypothetical protein
MTAIAYVANEINASYPNGLKYKAQKREFGCRTCTGKRPREQFSIPRVGFKLQDGTLCCSL